MPAVSPRYLLCALAAVLAAGCGTPERETEASEETAAIPARLAEASPSSLTPRFETLTIADGLVSNEANVFHQDRQGFLWIGTFGGLSRFDGASFVSYLHDPADPTSLGHNHVNSLVEGSDGSLWVGTNGGLDRMDPVTETFTHFRHDPDDPTTLGSSIVRTLVEGADGTIWAGTRGGGLNRVDPEVGTVRRIQTEAFEASASTSTVHVLTTGEGGTLWTGGSAGLSRFDPGTETFTHVRRDPTDPVSALLPTVTAILRDRAGRIWAGTRSEGLFRYDPTTRQVTHYPNQAGVPGAIANPWVLSLAETRDGTIWAGTNGAGLHRYDPEADAFDRFAFDPSDPQSLRDNNVLALLETRDGVLWAGTYGGLARQYPLSRIIEREAVRPGDPKSLSANDVTAFAEDEDGTLWVGVNGGPLNRQDPATGAFSKWVVDPSTPGTLGSERVFGLTVDARGAVWVSTYAGLYRREPGNQRFAMFLAPDDEMGMGVVFPLLEADGRLWTGNSGLLAIDTEAGQMTPYPLASRSERAYVNVREVLPDPSGEIWAGTYEGLFRLDPRTETWTHVHLEPEADRLAARPVITGLARDASGALWVGTGDGLYRLDTEGRDPVRFHRADGLPTTDITDIAVDRLGRLWVLTVADVSVFDPETERFVTYGVADGLGGGHELYQSPRTGRLYIGTTRGYATFDPSDLGSGPLLPPPTLTRLWLDGEAAREDASRRVTAMERLQLGYNDRVLRIGFASLDFHAPGTHRYAVRLDGFDEDWRDLGNQREATFTNLDPGRYTFRVRAAGRDGVWSDETALSLTVAPPWWRSWWAYALYAVALVGLAVVVVRYREERRQLAHEAEVERREAEALRELDRSKSAFFANVSHEFRTPITLTLGPLDDVLSGDYGPVSPEARESLGLARRSAERVLGLINQILDLSRLEAGSAPLRAQQVDLATFVETHLEAFGPLATHRRITLSLVPPEAPVTVWLDPEAVGTILTNVVGNALKFTPEGGSVRLGIEVNEGEARVSVRDSGPGIAPDDLEHIFDRFYQATSSGDRPLGSGIGLALARELAGLHSGSLTASSDLGFGSTFTLTLPLGRDHLRPEQIDERTWTPPAPPVETADDTTEADAPEADTASVTEAMAVDQTTVLVVDDQADIRAYVRRHLERAGYGVTEAVDGQDALEQVRDRLPDLIISDVMMPRLDGLGLCRALRSDPETDFLPVLLLTAKAATEDRLEGLAELCDDYLTKPFDVRELVARVDSLLAIRRRLRERFAALGWPGGDGAPGDGVSGDGRSDPSTLGADALTLSPSLPPVVSADEAFVASVQAAIRDRLSDETFGVGMLAEAVGLSRSHLLRRTTALMGASPSDLIRSARLDQAARLLSARAGTVSEIAYAVGFKSVAHFSDAFLSHTGVRPSAYAREST